MSEQKRVTGYMRGRLFWAKIFGAPRPNYDGDAREWTFEFEPDTKGKAFLKEHDLSDRLKDKRNKKGYEERDPFLIIKRKEFKIDGTRNEHIRVVDADNSSWSDNRLIGNETLADVKVTIVDYGPRKKKGIYPVAIRILDLVPYERQEFEPLEDDDKFVQKAQERKSTFAQDFGLDEEEFGEPDEEAPFDMDDEPEEEEQPTTKRRRAKKDADEDLDDDVPM